MSHTRFRFLTATAAALLATSLTACGSDEPSAPLTTAYTLPGERVYPEGIAADPRTGDTYVGSYTDGAVYRAAKGAGAAEVFLPSGADGRRTANGLKVDGAGRLWVTDSTHGVTVYDLASRTALARFEVPGAAPRFVNDLAITRDGTAYVTDSVRGVVYRITPAQLEQARSGGGITEMTTQFDLSGLLAARAPNAFNLNGIVADDRYLLVVDMVPGELYRIPLTGADPIRKVTLVGGDLVNGDGLELRENSLWAAHNLTNTITRWTLTEDRATATRTAAFTDPALAIPTTLVRIDDTTLVVASQFDRGGPMGEGTPTAPFRILTVTGI
ncbi:SMP-30/gluconolactonase/LRE family protein [Nocardia bovistercoris]|uniref:Superoxide dismutase n=1 Tax=Nocardia bovistercoris TaxID=2785916 RepID=A0A931IDP9_9NOCA|nr:superoxide dismutase [Nocardia bovistercoris]MBH0778217.1 superoxide dismutase [Nocardia bovistercoris]